MFGFGPVAADGYGIGYIIREESITMYVKSAQVLPAQTHVLNGLQMRVLETLADTSVPGYYPELPA